MRLFALGSFSDLLAFALLAVVLVIGSAFLIVGGTLTGRRGWLGAGLVGSVLVLIKLAPAAVEAAMGGEGFESPIVVGAALQLAAMAMGATALIRHTTGQKTRNQVRSDKAIALVIGGVAAALSLCALTLVSMRANDLGVEHVPRAAHIALARGHACILTVEGTVWCGGLNPYGQTGASMAWRRSPFAQVNGVVGARGLALGSDFSCALVEAGPICWGNLGELDPKYADAPWGQPPTLIEAASNAVEIQATETELAWRASDGTITATDRNKSTGRVPRDTVEFTVDGGEVCYRTESEFVGSTRLVRYASSEVAPVHIEGARRIANGRYGFDICVERADSISCHHSLDKELVKLDAENLVTDSAYVVCGSRGTKLVCATPKGWMPQQDTNPEWTVRELDVGAPIEALYGGPGGYCAQLEGNKLACVSGFGCFLDWLADGTCTPEILPGPLGASN